MTIFIGPKDVFNVTTNISDSKLSINFDLNSYQTVIATLL